MAQRCGVVGRALDRQIASRLDLTMGPDEAESLATLAEEWSRVKGEARRAHEVDVWGAAALLWSLLRRRESWFRTLEAEVVDDLLWFAARSLGRRSV